MKTICGSDCNECYRKDICPGICEQISKLIKEINSLHIKDMPEIVEIYEINGELINLEYTLPNGELVKFWNDTDIYWGTQVKIQNSEKNLELQQIKIFF